MVRQEIEVAPIFWEKAIYRNPIGALLGLAILGLSGAAQAVAMGIAGGAGVREGLANDALQESVHAGMRAHGLEEGKPGQMRGSTQMPPNVEKSFLL